MHKKYRDFSNGPKKQKVENGLVKRKIKNYEDNTPQKLKQEAIRPRLVNNSFQKIIKTRSVATSMAKKVNILELTPNIEII